MTAMTSREGVAAISIWWSNCETTVNERSLHHGRVSCGTGHGVRQRVINRSLHMSQMIQLLRVPFRNSYPDHRQQAFESI